MLLSARPLPRGWLATVWCISILKRCANSFLEQLVSIGNNLSRASFESNHFTQEHIDKVVGCHIFAARDEHSTFGELVDHSHDGAVAFSGRPQS